MIYRALLRLYPTSIREQFAEEMLSVHSSACERARSAGRPSYLRFQAWEIAGLLFDLAGAFRLIAFEGGSMKQLKWIATGGLLGLLAASAFLEFGFEEQYRSTAVINMFPGFVPEEFLPGGHIEMQAVVQRVTPNLLSIATLTNVIKTYGLYPSELRRMPLADVIEVMRHNLKLLSGRDEKLMISFSYPDRFLAQKVTQDIVGRFIQQHQREQLMSLASVSDIFMGEADGANTEWFKAEEALRKAQAIGQLNPRLVVDVDLARERYKTSKNRLAEVQRALSVANRKIGPNLELIDPASLPMRPDRNVKAILGAGLLGGAIAGYTVARMLTLLERKPEPALA